MRTRAVDHGDRRGHGAAGAHGVLELARDREVVGPRQAVRDERRLERDDRTAGRDLGRDDHDIARGMGIAGTIAADTR